MRTEISVEELLAQDGWNAERRKLREILLDCGLEETVRWGQLCYRLKDRGNVALIFGFKDSCAVGFFKGALLDDPDGRLNRHGEHTKSMRRMDFAGLDQIEDEEEQLRAFIHQAMANEKKGLRVERDESQMPDWPDELCDAFDANPDLRAAFEDLTPGRQRGYLIHFTGAKSSEARARRVAKYAPKILQGKGMHDR